ncbi:uncharacterized protein LOC129725477 [Wyeomyia smithii]|uniref:uncharacterized protein LOC129725477 n=1 Tax=Wyeomyia smithii TaxID=174621 RepID=UPI002467C981|nr:uncharacterized protein LOC129725477 [Wyeomyia smithii]
MQSIIKIFLPVLVVHVCRAQPAEVPGTLQTTSSLFLPDATAAFTCTAGSFDSGCKDCSTLIQCLGSLMALEIKCPALAPYCKKGSCSTRIDSDAGCGFTPIMCTGEGIFPDPNTCYVYHYCVETYMNSEVYVCPAGYVFDATTLQCKPSFFGMGCVTVKCPNSTGVGTYGNSKTFYAVCVYDWNALSLIMMVKCSNGAIFDGKKCVYQCEKEGSFTDTNNSSKYYQCYELNGSWGYYHLSCPDGGKFDAAKQVCVFST